MRGCKHTDNQQWYFEGPILRNKDDTSQCLDMRTSGSELSRILRHLFVSRVGEILQRWFRTCLGSRGDYNLYMGSCHGGDNQDFVWSGELVKVGWRGLPSMGIATHLPSYFRVFFLGAGQS